jgi:hypothetical protein
LQISVVFCGKNAIFQIITSVPHRASNVGIFVYLFLKPKSLLHLAFQFF